MIRRKRFSLVNLAHKRNEMEREKLKTYEHTKICTSSKNVSSSIILNSQKVETGRHPPGYSDWGIYI